MDEVWEMEWSPEADALFESALALDGRKRTEFLERRCAGRPDLRRRVENLLDASVAGESWFDRKRLPRVIGGMLDRVVPDATSGQPDDLGDEPQLAGQLVGRYRIVRPLGRGGMGTVYLAERADGVFQRRVALKLLRRGLDTDDIVARFLAERQILADLEHPGIARLIDGGSSADGRPYLVMEYVEGDPITDYCARHDPSLDQRLTLFIAVCDAVHHAHGHGVVHRDLKPANILVREDGGVRLLDFGIARLVGTDGEYVHTGPGVRLMTPDYASPEQVRGDHVGVASDVYQLGVLLYELVSGERPYTTSGRPPSEIERMVCREPVPPPSICAPPTDWPRSSRDLDSIALKALRKEPASRYGSAADLALDVRRYLERRPVAARSEARAYRLRSYLEWHRKGLLAALGVAVVSALAVGLWTRPPTPAAATPPGAVAVLPFRVSGADPSLDYLREGMVDLLSTKLTGEGGPRAIDPAIALDAWRRDGGAAGRDLSREGALSLASRVGAERLLMGEIVGTPASMILNASFLHVPEGRVEARATVQGSADSLLSLVDALTARLLIVSAGEEPRPLSVLASGSLPALQAYLEGRVDFRAARYEAAYDRFKEALGHDSTFALAAVNAYAAAWFSPRAGSDRMLELAWRGRERLDDRALQLVTTVLGPDYPAPYSQVERLVARRRLLDTWPDRVEPRYMYADRIYHWHALIGLAHGRERAAAQFRHALEADSGYAPTYQHLVPLLYSLGQTEEATALARAYLSRESAGGFRSFLTWRMAAARTDSAALARTRSAMATLPANELLRIVTVAVQDAVAVDDADRAMSVLRERGLTPSVRQRVEREDYILQLARGRPTAAARVAERLAQSQMDDLDFPRLEAGNATVVSALYGDGNRAVAASALEGLAREAFGPGDVPRGGARLPDLCTVAQWRSWNRDHRGVEAAAARLRAADERGPLKKTGPLCATLLEAIGATLRERPDAAERVAELDSILATGPHALFTTVVVPGNLAAARLYEVLGQPERALAAVRRRVYDFDSSNLMLATSLRLEGRLAASVGDHEGARRAYRHYLALREDPEPALRAQADTVRAALAALTGGSAPPP